MPVSDIMDIGRQGLAAERRALETTSQNIANANTPGFSRQRPVLESRGENLQNGGLTLAGVACEKVVRVHDAFLQNRVFDESMQHGFLSAQEGALRSLESLMSTKAQNLHENITSFFKNVRALSVNPDLATAKQVTVDSLKEVTTGVRDLNSSLESLGNDLDLKLQAETREANGLGRELANLNEKITTYEAGGQTVNELKDRRDTVVELLGKKLGFQRSVDEKGNVNLYAPGVGAFVAGNQSTTLEARREGTPDKRGELSLFLINDHGDAHEATESTQSGEMGGMLRVRNGTLNQLRRNLDAFSFQFSKSINEVYQQGAGNAQRPALEGSETAQGHASTLHLNPELEKNSGLFSAGLTEGMATDNRLALKMVECEKAPLVMAGLEPNPGSPEGVPIGESVPALIAHVGIETQNIGQEKEQQDSVMEQLHNYKQSVSGVSLEEEALHMMQYQNSFNAAAKTIKVGDELLKTLLTLKD